MYSNNKLGRCLTNEHQLFFYYTRLGGELTQTFEEYIAQIYVHRILCKGCKIFLCYMVSYDEIILCPTCMKKDYEENKK